MEQALISKMWDEIHKSPIVDIRRVVSIGAYLAKYLKKDGARYHASYNWVFPGWLKWTKKIKRLIGRYPSRSIIKVLAQLEREKRKEAMWSLTLSAVMRLEPQKREWALWDLFPEGRVRLP